MQFLYFFRFMLFIGACIVLAGCGDDGGRQNISGKITFAGEPIPFGKISFRPDHKRGGTGPAGFATVMNGEYSTKSSGKGAIAGPVEVIIEGLVSDAPMATPLFMPYKTTSDIEKGVKQLDFDVPKGKISAALKRVQQIPMEDR